MSYSLIIPIYNEEKRLPQLLKELELLSYNLEVILINDGSTDETKSILDDQKLFKTLHKTKNRGKGSALISGYKIANQENIIFMDADLEISTSEIPKMIKEFEENNLDALVGTRWEKIGKFSDLHFLGNFFINVFFNFLFKSNFTDILCCLKIMKSHCLEKMKFNSNGFGIESEIMAKIILNELSFMEKKVLYKRRSKSEGKKLKYSDALVILTTIIKNRFNVS